jgi:lipopolysaccharide export system protein LptA
VWLTIERMRTLVLGAAVLLVVALGVFLAISRFKGPLIRRDIPKRLGIDIEQEANGVTYTQSSQGHTLFKIHASKVVQLKNDHAVLHDVQIELYGADGNRVDRIEGNEFEYDQKEGTATAAGPVEITLMRPGEAPAIAPKATQQQAARDKSKGHPLAAAAQAAANSEIHVKTSGLTFDQKSEVATTAQRVDFSMSEGSGSSMGASYDSQQGFLVLDRAVELTTQRGANPVEIHAAHAQFERDTDVCNLQAATADYRGGHATAAEAKILFRNDGTAVRLDATGGFTLATATGGRVAAPTGSMEFDEHNQPRHGHLAGGVSMDSASGVRTVHGTSPTAELEFTTQGQLRHAHLERGVEMHSEETNRTATNGQTVAAKVSRSWRSPVADVEFRNVGKGQVEPASMHGFGGVVVDGVSQRGNGTPSPSMLSADEVSGEFGPYSMLRAMSGTGHASMEQTTATGTRQAASGDRLEAHFAPAGGAAKSGVRRGAEAPGGAAQIESAVLDGHVVLVERPGTKAGAQPQPEMHATAGHAVYEGAGEWLHLTESPRVEDGGIELTADKIDVSQGSGDAFAHGNIKGTWTNGAGSGTGAHPPNQKDLAGQYSAVARDSAAGRGSVGLGGEGPAHVIAAEAELHQATDEATFRGNARLWQQANSVTGPVIVLDRRKQTLVARSTDSADPVKAVLLSEGSLNGGKPEAASGDAAAKPATPSVIRVRGGDLSYFDVERRAVMRGGVLGTVTAETGTATSVSNVVELKLTPAASHASGQGQVERMTATGRVTVSSQGRRGTGEQLVYTGATGNYVLTGTAATPPKMVDPQRGTVSGEALIFHSRDDSVSIEGGGHETTTETTAPK